MRNNIRVFGLLFILIGLILVANSFRLTGFAVLESVEGTATSIIGILLVVGGIILVSFGRQSYSHLKSRAALRQHNSEARWAARRAYRTQYGHNPTRVDLRKYERTLHDSGDMDSVVEEQKSRRK